MTREKLIYIYILITVVFETLSRLIYGIHAKHPFYIDQINLEPLTRGCGPKELLVFNENRTLDSRRNILTLPHSGEDPSHLHAFHDGF